MTRAELDKRYREKFGAVPALVRQRLDVSQAAGRMDALSAMEAFREAVLDGNPLETRTQRLVHFGLTLAISEDEAIAAHALAAQKAGASLPELVGVCETAAVVLGMPAYTRGMRALARLLPPTNDEQGA